MTNIIQKFPAGSSGWGTCLTAGKGQVGLAITGPQDGWYNGDWMTLEQAEEFAIGVIRTIQLARKRTESVVLASKDSSAEDRTAV